MIPHLKRIRFRDFYVIFFARYYFDGLLIFSAASPGGCLCGVIVGRASEAGEAFYLHKCGTKSDINQRARSDKDITPHKHGLRLDCWALRLCG